MLVSFALGDANFLRFYPTQNLKVAFYPTGKAKRKPVDYRLRWVPTQNFRVGHVHFMFFV